MSNSPSHRSVASSSSLPSFVSHVDLNAIASLAISARNRDSSSSFDGTVTVNPEPKIGGYNVVWFIDFSDGVSWVFRTPMAKWTPVLEERMRSDILGMKLISRRTGIPIPKIHDYAIGKESLNLSGIERPYVIMDKVKGTQLAKVWFDREWFTEEKRKKVWRGIVDVMVQLKSLEFGRIGCLTEENGEIVVGEFIPSLDACETLAEQEESPMMEIEKRGPYTTVHAYLLDGIERHMRRAPSLSHKASLLLLRLFAASLPDEEFDGPPFVLLMPDFGYQNVFIDEQSGEVTGLIDWDNIFVGPRQGGYAKYPSWITRDWDPTMYGWPEEEEEEVSHEGEEGNFEGEGKGKSAPSREALQEDSPATLQSFREEYLAAFMEVDPESAKYTRNSHVYEALDIAIWVEFTRGNILHKLCRYVFGKEAESGEMMSSWRLKQGIESGHWVKAQK